MASDWSIDSLTQQAGDVVSWISKEAQDYDKLFNPTTAAPANANTAAPPETVGVSKQSTPANAGSSMTPLLIVGGLVVALLILR